MTADQAAAYWQAYKPSDAELSDISVGGTPFELEWLCLDAADKAAKVLDKVKEENVREASGWEAKEENVGEASGWEAKEENVGEASGWEAKEKNVGEASGWEAKEETGGEPSGWEAKEKNVGEASGWGSWHVQCWSAAETGNLRQGGSEGQMRSCPKPNW
jgi:hypothetical protein